MADDRATGGARSPSHRNSRQYHRRRRKNKGAVDIISSLPDEMLQHILSFIPTELAIKTCILSKRWRHVWCDIPSLSFEYHSFRDADFIDETLTRYTAPKMINFHLYATKLYMNFPQVDTWIKFAMSLNVKNLSLDFSNQPAPYDISDFFYINSSVKQLTIALNHYDTMIPRCSVSWTSLKKLYLRYCCLSDEFFAKILPGCPILESLALHYCYPLPQVFDLSKSMRLRTLEINGDFWEPYKEAMQIVAPHIHCLRFTHFHLPCTDLVDVSSLTEAKLMIQIDDGRLYGKKVKASFIQVTVLKMLEKLKNVEKLTFGGNFLQMLSFAELRGVPFPMFKVKSLTLETGIFRYVIPGIERVLQNSPGLKKLIVHTTDSNDKMGVYLDDYMDLEGLNLDQCWRSKYGVFWNKSRSNVESKHVVSFVELMMKNTKTLDKMVVLLEDHYLRFKELVATLSHNYTVSITLYTQGKLPSIRALRATIKKLVPYN